jgi:hypothetical protein
VVRVVVVTKVLMVALELLVKAMLVQMAALLEHFKVAVAVVRAQQVVLQLVVTD